jgi:Mor family transcriptional regulator
MLGGQKYMEVKESRNKQIYEDKKTLSYTQLIQKYGLSLATLQRIVQREKLREFEDAQNQEKTGN